MIKLKKPDIILKEQKYVKAELFFGFLICFILTHQNSINACRCSPLPSPGEAFKYCDVVFSGVVRKIEYISGNNKVHIDLIYSWKENLNHRILVWIPAAGPACGFDFKLEDFIRLNFPPQTYQAESIFTG